MTRVGQTNRVEDSSGDQVLFTRMGDSARSHEIMLQQAARLAKLGYFVFNIDAGIVEVCSERHASIFGRTPDEFMSLVTGLKGDMKMMHPDDAQSVRAAYERLRSGETIELEYRFYAKDGSLGQIREVVAPERNAEGRVVRGLGSSMDVTELRLLEQERAHTSRLEALGELTAGVAHDFNNLLAVVLGNAELAGTEASRAERDRCLMAIADAAERGGALTRNLLSFAQQASISPRPTDINDEVLRAVETFDRTALKKVSLTAETSEEALVVNVDRDQLQSVFINLLINARDAIEADGRIRVSTYVADRSDVRRLMTERHLKDDRYCAVEFADNGCGIPSAHLPRVTEPFFTTKSRADGSGLGLSMATGFARQADGALEIRSRESAGTLVTIYFPLVNEIPEIDAKPEVKEPSSSRRKLLLLEDDPAVAKMLNSQFSLAGFLVTTVESADQLRGALRSNSFDIAVLDNILPEDVRGIDLAKHVKALRPDTKIILYTGYVDPELSGGSLCVDSIITKPTPFAVLLGSVEKLLESSD